MVLIHPGFRGTTGEDSAKSPSKGHMPRATRPRPPILKSSSHLSSRVGTLDTTDEAQRAESWPIRIFS
jgi:hypothetical protein